jgi:hypothetical protein
LRSLERGDFEELPESRAHDPLHFSVKAVCPIVGAGGPNPIDPAQVVNDVAAAEDENVALAQGGQIST